MAINDDMHIRKTFPLISPAISPIIKLDDDDGSEEDFILLQMPLVPKKFILKQDIKIEKDECIKDNGCSQDDESEEFEVDLPDESSVDNCNILNQQVEQQEDLSKAYCENQKAELEQKISDVKSYYSTISSLCNKLDAFIKSVDQKLAHVKLLQKNYTKSVEKAPELAGSKCCGWTHVFGTPYFKDRQYFFPPKNYDVLQKEHKHEININNLPITHLWKPIEKHKVGQAIRVMEVQNQINMCQKKAKELREELHNMGENTDVSAELELEFLTERQKLIEQLSLAELVRGTTNEYDWLKISVTELHNHHSPEECRSMWFAYLHPDINKGEWTMEEQQMLKDLAAEHNYQNWSLIAKQLGTRRSEYQCLRFYQMNLNDQLTKSNWTEEEDQRLHQMVDRYTVGSVIRWGKVTANLEGRTKFQIFSRWKYVLEPGIRKGRFSEEEDLMILAGVKWYGKNFRQISRFIPGRTGNQLRDRFNTSLESIDYVWDAACDEKLIEMVEEFGPSCWSFISKTFPGFSSIQIRHRYLVIKKWQRNGNEGFPPIRRNWDRKNYEEKLREIMGLHFQMTEEKAAVVGDKPLLQIQKKLGLQYRKKRAPSKRRTKRNFTTVLDSMYLKHFSVSYYCQRSTHKRVVNKEVIVEDGKILKSFLTVLNATLNIPNKNVIDKHSELKNPVDQSLLAYLRDGTVPIKILQEQEARKEDKSEKKSEEKTYGIETAKGEKKSGEKEKEHESIDISSDVSPIVSPVNYTYTLAENVNKNLIVLQNVSSELGSLSEVLVMVPVQVHTEKNINSLSSMLPRKCSYSIAESFKGNVKQTNNDDNLTSSMLPRMCSDSLAESFKGNVRQTKHVDNLTSSMLPPNCSYSRAESAKGNVRQAKYVDTLTSSMLPRKCSYSFAESLKRNVRQAKHVDNMPSSSQVSPTTSDSVFHLESDSSLPGVGSVVRTFASNVQRNISPVGTNNFDASVPIDNGLTIRWCIVPNYATLIGCKTLLLSKAPLARTMYRPPSRLVKSEKIKKDTASAKLSLKMMTKSDDPLHLQEMIAELDTGISENRQSQGKCTLTSEEADVLCKQRFVSVLLFPALASIRNVKVFDDLFELSSLKGSKSRAKEQMCTEAYRNTPVFMSEDTALTFKQWQNSTLKENRIATNGVHTTTMTQSEVQIIKENKKRKAEKTHVEDGSVTLSKKSVLPMKKHKLSCPSEPTRKSERLRKPKLH